MKLLTMQKDSGYKLGVLTPKGVLDVENAAKVFNVAAPSTMENLIEGGEAARKKIEELIKLADEANVDGLFLPENQVTYGPCVTDPEKIICVGLNYRKHAEESGMALPTSPVLFSKFNNALSAHKSTVKIPPLAQKVDYEAELVIVIGKTASGVSKDDALSYVFGYATGNDLSVRALQMRTSQWMLGKTSDGFAPVGPYIVTADQIPNPNALHIESRVNKGVRQSSNTADMIFDCATLISYISDYMTLKPGDIIFTGTPEGVILGYPVEKQVWLKPGDEVTTFVENLGELTILLS